MGHGDSDGAAWHIGDHSRLANRPLLSHSQNAIGMSHHPVYYFDNNATTRIAPEVVEAMLPFLKEHYGNPSSAYGFGRDVANQVEEARTKVAALINAEPRE